MRKFKTIVPYVKSALAEGLGPRLGLRSRDFYLEPQILGIEGIALKAERSRLQVKLSSIWKLDLPFMEPFFNDYFVSYNSVKKIIYLKRKPKVRLRRKYT